MIDQDRLASIRQRRAAITTPPWHADIEGAIYTETVNWLGEIPRDRDREFIAHAPDDIDHLLAEVERLRGLLRQIQWSATIPTYGDETEDGCPVCQQPRLDGHAPTCWLATELA